MVVVVGGGGGGLFCALLLWIFLYKRKTDRSVNKNALAQAKILLLPAGFV